MNSFKEILSGFLSPAPIEKQITPRTVKPGTPNQQSSNMSFGNKSPVAKQLFPPNGSQTGGKRKSLKRKNKKNNKTKRR